MATLYICQKKAKIRICFCTLKNPNGLLCSIKDLAKGAKALDQSFFRWIEKAKDLKRLGRGYRNFEHFRNRFLYATRENPVINGSSSHSTVYKNIAATQLMIKVIHCAAAIYNQLQLTSKPASISCSVIISSFAFFLLH